MPQWAGSSWYFLRDIDPHNKDELAESKEEIEYWMPVDWYNDGMERTTYTYCIQGSGINSYMILE